MLDFSFEISCSLVPDSFYSEASVCSFSSLPGGRLPSSWSSSTSTKSFSNSVESALDSVLAVAYGFVVLLGLAARVAFLGADF